MDDTGPRHQVWGSIETRDNSTEEGSHSRDSHRQQMEERLRDVVLNGESLSSDLTDSCGTVGDLKVDVNAVREKIMGMKPTQKGNPNDPEAAAEEGDEEAEEEAGEDDGDGAERKGVWSKGSVRHEDGSCRPCHYYQTKTGCMNGDKCSFCHLDHPKRFRPRPCKSKRNRCKRLANMLDMVFTNLPDQFDEAAEIFSQEKGYLSHVIKSKVRSLKEAQAVEAGTASQADQGSAGKPKQLMSL